MATIVENVSESGLSEAEAAARLLADGPNELPSSRARGLASILLDVLKEPMFLLLLVCGGIYFALGDRQEGLILLGFVFVVAGITLFQEQKTARALEALRDLSSPRALVNREGKRSRIAGRGVVLGDLVMLSEGDRVPADGAVTSCSQLSTDESLRTGDSLPVSKVRWNGHSPMARPGGENLAFVFSGTPPFSPGGPPARSLK